MKVLKGRVKLMKHNKKRNTAFLYEVLVRELTYSIISEDVDKKQKIVAVLKEFFASDRILGQELALCQALHETSGVEKEVAEKMLTEIKRVYFGLSQPEIFNQQTELIKTINRDIGKKTFSNFVPNFKSLATIAQIFDDKIPVKSRVLLENKIVGKMSTEEQNIEELSPIDNLVYKKFTEKFNQKYSDSLTENQKELLNRYIISFSDNGVALKMFLNDEIPMLSEKIEKSMTSKEIQGDEKMVNKSKTVLTMLEQFKQSQVDREMISKILKIQNLVTELDL